jgi:hypothetical protein
MNKTIEKRLENFMFPVEERAVYVQDDPHLNLNIADNYKAIVRTDNGSSKLISIMKDTYQLVPNREVILPLIQELHNLDNKWIIDPSHSFVADSRMRLQITFPELTLNDGTSEIALSLFLHNSYDGSEGVRLFWGAIREICSNGMVFGTLLSKYYHRHTAGLNISSLKEKLQATYDKVPVIRHRIEMMQNTAVTPKFRREVEDQLGKHVIKYVDQHEQQNKRSVNLWMLFNIVTYYISHLIEQRKRAQYQISASRLFKL